MDRRAFLAATASTTLVAVAGCSGDGGGDGDGDSGGAGNQTGGNDSSGNETGGDGTSGGDSAAQVTIGSSSFEPLRQSVEPGEEVVWTNQTDATHTVDTQTFHESAEEWSISSRTLDPSDSVSHTFEESGVYEYFCAVHGESNMCGAILVGDVSLDEKLPCEESTDAGGQESGDQVSGDGNETEGNETSGAGNETAGNDSGGSGNETSGNATDGGNGTSGNESA